ncbi:VWA domain-containing protein [Pseudomonas xionganensis]|uniref:VWA domain-containing protein n=1 Tax=Pseudomonas xionganensis TaxID=2654845 RepID=A0A6I4KSF2_9PSED|nr:VWA domain-containing protein [Pseudomonas xionganensis]MVW75490.1 VWA domain-containing protein [Pseudomonas xionganensis]
MSLLALWPHWARPLWLLAVPVLGWLLWSLWQRKQRSGQWQQLLPAAFHAVLLRGGHNRRSRLPLLLLALAWLLALLALLGPSWQKLEQDRLKPADPLVVLLQLTPSMLAGDATPNRLEQAKRKLLDLLEARQDAQTAIVVYAGSAHTLVPLSDDLGTSRNLLDALKPSIMPEPGQRADLALTRALQLLEQGALGEGRLLLLGSSLQADERSAITQALADSDTRLQMIGFGSSQGAPIQQEDGSFMKDAEGAILVPRLDSNSLRTFFAQLGGAYQRASLDEQDLRSLGLLERSPAVRHDAEQTRLERWAEQGHWLLLPLLMLAAASARRGWLLCLPLLLCLPQPSYALSFDDLWLRADQQGQRLLDAQRPAEAAKRFKDPQWQGLALYQAGDYAGAAERFAQGEDAIAHYNRGNALALSNELEAALDAYAQALRLQPELSQAQQNMALIEELLKQKEQADRGQSADQAESHDPANEAPSQSASQGQSQSQTAGGAGQPEPSDAQPAEQTAAEQSQATAQSASPPGEQASAGSANEATPTNTDGAAEAPSELDGERRQALEQWLRQIPDDPAELLRRKFWLEQQERQEYAP